MNFLDAEFVQEFIRMANDGWEQGWHERNGGNLSYRVKPEEVELIKENFKAKEWQPIGTSVPNLAGEFFLVTGSGKTGKGELRAEGVPAHRHHRTSTGRRVLPGDRQRQIFPQCQHQAGRFHLHD